MNSICIATYNGEKYIKEQLDSILVQIESTDEVIVSDDGSKDKTIQIIESINDSRIKILKNETNWHGCVGNFQNALLHANGKYIFLADQDDVWFPNKYNVMISELNNTGLVHCNSKVTDANLNIINDSFYSLLNHQKGILKNIMKSTYYGSHMAFQSTLLKYALPFPKTREIGHDLWLGLIAEITTNVKFLNEPLMFYRRHDTSFCDVFEGSKRPFYKKILGRIIMIFYLIRFYLVYLLNLKTKFEKN